MLVYSVCAPVFSPLILTFCQVLALITFAAGASFSADIWVTTESLRSSAGGWLAFVGFIVMLIELAIIVARFINFAFVSDYPLVVMIVVSACNQRPQACSSH